MHAGKIGAVDPGLPGVMNAARGLLAIRVRLPASKNPRCRFCWISAQDAQKRSAMTRLACFKSYDIRGRVGDELTEALALRIGAAFVKVTSATHLVVGHDCRASSPALSSAVAQGAMAAGADVSDIGQCGTEEVYFATDHLGAGGGLMITASHNPISDNGIKLIGTGATPVSQDQLQRIHDLVVSDAPLTAPDTGSVAAADPRAAYCDRVLSFVDPAALRPMRIVVNPGNGTAGPTFDALADALAETAAPLEFIRLHHDPDPTFPNGIPNPLLPENRPVTADAVRAHKADLGIAWDGDFDRCFFFDEAGEFVDGEYIVGLLAAAMLDWAPGGRIVHDPRVQWNTLAEVARAGGMPEVSRTGHVLIKETMRRVDAVYGGEMSAHHYFRDFMYCDSGMIPWLLVAARMSALGQPLSAIIAGMRAAFPSSGDINFRVSDADAAIDAVTRRMLDGALKTDHLDGLSAEFDDWRFNLRRSNTEPLLRLNIEARGNPALVAETLARFRAFLDGA